MSHVYFIEAAGSGLIKIGRANRVKARLNGLRSGCPVPLHLLLSIAVVDAPAAEREMHQRFAHLRQHGEWFRAEPELADFIRENQPAPPPAPGPTRTLKPTVRQRREAERQARIDALDYNDRRLLRLRSSPPPA